MTGPVDDHTCGEPNPWGEAGDPCPCWLDHGHHGRHQCQHGWTWR